MDNYFAALKFMILSKNVGMKFCLLFITFQSKWTFLDARKIGITTATLVRMGLEWMLLQVCEELLEEGFVLFLQFYFYFRLLGKDFQCDLTYFLLLLLLF
jgi:hypothetical protein